MKTINPDNWIALENKYNNKCKNCGLHIPIGEKVLWKKGNGIKHEKCEAVTLVEKMPEKIVVTDKEWEDFTTYSYEKLLIKTECQCCGRSFGTRKDKWINCDRRVCEKCFTA